MNEPSWRKPVGVLLILLLIGLWSVAVVMLAEALALPLWASGPLFVAGGIMWLWALPMKRLLRWMETGRWRDQQG